jgi:peptidoglycan/LPS O-acetylase OafA/YrhL
VTIFGLVMTPAHSYPKKILEQKFLVLMGTLSYGIYMWHEAVWWVINNGLRHVAKVETTLHSPSGKTIMILDDLQVYGILIIGMIITIIISYLSYRLVEMPINNVRHKLRMK